MGREDFNSVKLIGYIRGNAPETRFTKGGLAVTTVTLAVGGGKKNDGTYWPTHWIDIKAFSEIAEALAEYKKGDSVQLKGELCQESWKDKATQAKRSKIVVIVKELAGKAEESTEKKEYSKKDYYIQDGDEDSIPF